MPYFIADFGNFKNRKLTLLTHLIRQNISNTDLLLLGGDNFYPCGINAYNKEEKEQLFKKTFENLKEQSYAVLGNHDYMSNVRNMINNSNIFKMPNKYYKLEYKNYDIFMIDTMIIAPFDSRDETNIFCGLNSRGSKQHVIKELRYNHLIWLDTELGKTVKYGRIPIVIGHYMIYSNGFYSVYNKCNKLFSYLVPLFVKHKVPLYISGHDHTTQLNIFNSEQIKYIYDSIKCEDPIIKILCPNFQESLIDNNYVLHSIVSGACIDSYFGDNFVGRIFESEYFNNVLHLYTKLDLNEDNIIINFLHNNNFTEDINNNPNESIEYSFKLTL